MSTEDELLKFAENLRQEVIATAETGEKEQLREDQFTELMIGYLTDAGEIDDGMVCFQKALGLQVNGYAVSEDEEYIDLFVSHCTLTVPPETIRKAEIETGFKRLQTFFAKCLKQYHLELEEASPVFDLALRIWELRDSLSRARLYFLTDGISNVSATPPTEINDIDITYHVWDIQRLYQCWSSGRHREAIEVNFAELPGGAVFCLPCSPDGGPYTCYLASLTGEMLAAMYGKFGPRLLERNVRSFLQARGNVNKGIRQTIIREPEMFLAYNNGLSATAERVDVNQTNGHMTILKAVDFQIVNGGQTTGSLYHAFRRDKADLAKVRVPMKLTVLMDPTRMEAVVPRISECANSQNKINTADFSANDPFHIKIQEFSRTIWAPALEGMQRQTRWYYERARGQYQDDKGRQETPARKKAWEQIHPSPQKFTKTDLAKFENTWSQLPHIVSRGAQKNFQDFTVRLKERGQVQVDEPYFHRLVAKAIMFRRAEKLVDALDYGGYRANIVTYTLAYLSYRSAQRIDLDRIWREQSLSPGLAEAINVVSKLAFTHITGSPGGGNITEWCKKEACWKNLREQEMALPQGFMDELLPMGSGSTVIDQGIQTTTPAEEEIIQEVASVPADVWFTIAGWAKQTNNLQGWQRSIAFSLGRLIGQGRSPSRKQAIQGKKILEEAKERGFDSEKST